MDSELLVVTYLFTNNSDEEDCAFNVLQFRVYQDDTELERVYDIEVAGDNDSKNIKPGESIECKAVFRLSSESNVEEEVTDTLTLSDGRCRKVYALE